MTIHDALAHQMDEAGFQLVKSFEGLTEDQADFSLITGGMTLAGTATHLADCYVAVQKQATGEEHQWGSFVPSDPSLQGCIDAAFEQRALAVDAVLNMDEDKAVSVATSFMTLHDAYHVGQICAMRLALDPDWNPYSIYPS